MSSVMYRYEDVAYSSDPDESGECRGMPRIDVVLHEFPVLRETAKGVWLGDGFDERFILNNSKKKFACRTIELAHESFVARKKRQIQIYQAGIWRAEKALASMGEQVDD